MKKDLLPDETRKFTWMAAVLTSITVLIMISNAFQDTFIGEVGDYLKRRYYYEQSIENSGLELHRGMHWKQHE